jgi:3-phosphoshikimate 1-carboxyvinyltransferase
VTVRDWPIGTTQPGDQLRELLTTMGGECSLTPDGLTVRGTGRIHGLTADLAEVGELTPVLAALAALADSPSRLTGIGHIRAHETDRLAALARELGRLGVQVHELPDGLEIHPRPLTGAVFETYDDHRMAHAAAVIGLTVPGVDLTDVACTSKTLPQFPALWSAMVHGNTKPGGGGG